MQEFTFSTSDPKQPQTQSSNQDAQDQVAEVLQQVQVQEKPKVQEPEQPSPQPNIPTTPPPPKPHKKKQAKPGEKKELNPKVVLATMLAGIFTAAAGFSMFLLLKPKSEDVKKTGEVKGEFVHVEDENSLEIPDNLKDTFLYTDNYNIFKTAKDGSTKEQLTDYKHGEDIQIKDLELIDSETLGYFRCQTTGGDYFNCEILRLNFLTKEVSSVQKIEGSRQLSQLSWASKDVYAYSLQDTTSNQMLINLVNNEVTNQIASIYTERNNRKTFVEDSQQLQFSPENKRILYLNTLGNQGFDFTLYVYDLSGTEIDRIDDATTPTWADEDTIVYRRYANIDSGALYFRDISVKRSFKMRNTAFASYDPKSFNSNLIYWEASNFGRSHIYDREKNSDELLKERTAFPIWLSQDEVILAQTRECKPNECSIPNTLEFENQFRIEEFFIHNLINQEETKIDIEPEYLQNGIVTWYNRHI
ncbi:hypothetical protein JW766_05940 [Candidatus Dojkabacteria bacterium]|nr:hypothetical protein [Candidatus Dojkabacteria bacterium]